MRPEMITRRLPKNGSARHKSPNEIKSAISVPTIAAPKAIQMLLKTASIKPTFRSVRKWLVVNIRSLKSGTPPNKLRLNEQNRIQRTGKDQQIPRATMVNLVKARIGLLRSAY